jgi:phytoene synthase
MTTPKGTWAAQMRSAEFRAFADDTAKDDDNAAFLAALSPSEQKDWLVRLGWVRISDRLSENEVVEPQARRFTRFCADWRAFRASGVPAGEHESVWREMRVAWYEPSGALREARAVRAWDDYLAALAMYTQPRLRIATLADHDRMVQRLTGNCFELAPYLRDSERDAASRFGALDQTMSNLRDIAEDASHDFCFFPRDLLHHFGVRRGAILDGSAIRTREYTRMMRFWLDEHLVTLQRAAAPFLTLPGLHPSVRQAAEAFRARHARIERVFREVSFDYLAFPGEYWKARTAA